MARAFSEAGPSSQTFERCNLMLPLAFFPMFLDWYVFWFGGLCVGFGVLVCGCLLSLALLVYLILVSLIVQMLCFMVEGVNVLFCRRVFFVFGRVLCTLTFSNLVLLVFLHEKLKDPQASRYWSLERFPKRIDAHHASATESSPSKNTKRLPCSSLDPQNIQQLQIQNTKPKMGGNTPKKHREFQY